MGRVVQLVAAGATSEVMVGDLTWRVRRITTADLVAVGLPGLFTSLPPAEGDVEETIADRLAGATPAELSAVARYSEAVVAAGTVALGQGGEWETVRVVLDYAARDVDRAILHVSDLTAGTVEALFAAVMALSGQREAATKLATFRGRRERRAGG